MSDSTLQSLSETAATVKTQQDQLDDLQQELADERLAIKSCEKRISELDKIAATSGKFDLRQLAAVAGVAMTAAGLVSGLVTFAIQASQGKLEEKVTEQEKKTVALKQELTTKDAAAQSQLTERGTWMRGIERRLATTESETHGNKAILQNVETGISVAGLDRWSGSQHKTYADNQARKWTLQYDTNRWLTELIINLTERTAKLEGGAQ